MVVMVAMLGLCSCQNKMDGDAMGFMLHKSLIYRTGSVPKK